MCIIKANKTKALLLAALLILPGYLYCLETGRLSGIKNWPLNNAQTYSQVVSRETRVFMAGVNHYAFDSGYAELRQSLNDLRLLERIFTRCCKINGKNIFLYCDLTLAAFTRAFTDFIKALPPDCPVIFYFAGHSTPQGDLIFADGARFSREQLQTAVNTFSNDTIIILDTCYAGITVPETGFAFKPNCMVIASTLSITTAKEITYNDAYFAGLLPFYRDTLGIDAMEGNGFFTAMCGLFFAVYPLQRHESITWNTIVYFITEKCKAMIETERNPAFIGQIPKISSPGDAPAFSNPRHKYVLQQDQDALFALNSTIGALIPFSGRVDGYPVSFEPGFAFKFAFDYKLVLDWGIINLGMSSGLLWIRTYIDGYYQERILATLPVSLHGRCTYNINDLFFVCADLNLGLAFTIPYINNALAVESVSSGFYVNPAISAGIVLFQAINIAVSCDFYYLSHINNLFLVPGIEAGLRF